MKIAPAYLQLGDFPDGLAVLDLVIQENAGDKNALILRCWARAASKQLLDQAIHDCNSALEIGTPYASAFDARGLVYYRMGNTAAAIADFDSALQINPHLFTSLYVRGLTKLKAGDAVGGNADIAAAKAVDPQIADQYAGFDIKP